MILFLWMTKQFRFKKKKKTNLGSVDKLSSAPNWQAKFNPKLTNPHLCSGRCSFINKTNLSILTFIIWMLFMTASWLWIIGCVVTQSSHFLSNVKSLHGWGNKHAIHCTPRLHDFKHFKGDSDSFRVSSLLDWLLKRPQPSIQVLETTSITWPY